ncbi:MAG: isocitrate/isopropylmalate dehydrogenase family protein [Culicoidibacterales bacterium]
MVKVTLIPGDGIGPEIATAVVDIFAAAKVDVEFEVVNAGMAVLAAEGVLVPESVYKSIERNKIVLKGPITTPIGAGFRSINVALRKKYDLYANIRPIKSLPNVLTRYENIDLVIFRENTEGLYIGEEYFENDDKDTAIALKRITRQGSYRIIKAAFEHADRLGINKVTVAHKANILKLTDGLFLAEAKRVSLDYPHIALEAIIIDNMCMQLVMNPTQFGVIVTMNLYGDILSDLCAGLVGGLGLAPGANIGADIAIFEAVHGSAPDIIGQNKANPLALLFSGINLLEYIGQNEAAARISGAIERVLRENKVRTQDLGGVATTTAFVEAIKAAL